jgi:hypothetical protein
MHAIGRKLTAVVLMGFAAAGLSTSTAVADGRAGSSPATVSDEIGGLPNLNGYCREYGWDHSKPLDPGDAYSWVCVVDATGETGVIDMDYACRWHHRAYPNSWASPLNKSDAFSWRCYA